MRLARAQRLTGRATELGRAEARSAVRGRGVPGGSHVRPTRTTEPGSRDDRPHTGATSLQTCLVFSAPRPRPSKSPGIHRKTPARPQIFLTNQSFNPGSAGISRDDPGMRLSRSQRRTGTRRIQRGALRSTTRRSSSMPGSVYGRSCSPAWITRTSLWAVARIHPGSRRSVGATTDAESSAGTPRCTGRCRSSAPRVMVSFCDVGSAAAPREVLAAAYSGTCRAPSRNPTLRGPDD